MTILGEYIRSARTEKGLSLRECAKLCGISHTRIDVIEKGVDPNTGKEAEVTTDTLMKIAQGLNLDVLYLLSLNVAEKGYDVGPVEAGIGANIQAAAAHFDLDTLTDEGKKQYEDFIAYLAEKFSKE